MLRLEASPKSRQNLGSGAMPPSAQFLPPVRPTPSDGPRHPVPQAEPCQMCRQSDRWPKRSRQQGVVCGLPKGREQLLVQQPTLSEAMTALSVLPRDAEVEAGATWEQTCQKKTWKRS
jgi:hypothetical protein